MLKNSIGNWRRGDEIFFGFIIVLLLFPPFLTLTKC